MKTLIAALIGCLSLFLLGWRGALAQTAPSTPSCTSPLDSAAYNRFDVLYGATYKQTNATGVGPAAKLSYGLEASLSLATNLTAPSATVTLPGQAPRTLAQSEPGRFFFVVATNSFAGLTASYPGGAFTFEVLNTSTTVNLPSGSSLPNPPTISNYDAAQSIDPTRDFNLTWVPFSGGNSQDYIIVAIDDPTGLTVLKTSSSGCPSSLDGTATSVRIPAGTLTTNQTYRVSITFAHVLTLDIPPQPGTLRISGTEASTGATISTGSGGGGAPPASLVLTNLARLSGGSLRFDLLTTPGASYTIQFNPRLGDAAGWNPLLTTNASSSLLSFTNQPPVGGVAGFYRADRN